MISMTPSISVLLALVLGLALETPSTLAFPGGAGACVSGRPSVFGSHLSTSKTILTGNLADGNLELLVNGDPAKTTETIKFFPSSVRELSLVGTGGFKGFLIRLGDAESSSWEDAFFEFDAATTKFSDNCLGDGMATPQAGGVTHISPAVKTQVNVKIEVPMNIPTGFSMMLDVTVVIANNETHSIYYHDTFPVLYSAVPTIPPPRPMPSLAPIPVPAPAPSIPTLKVDAVLVDGITSDEFTLERYDDVAADATIQLFQFAPPPDTLNKETASTVTCKLTCTPSATGTKQISFKEGTVPFDFYDTSDIKNGPCPLEATYIMPDTSSFPLYAFATGLDPTGLQHARMTCSTSPSPPPAPMPHPAPMPQPVPIPAPVPTPSPAPVPVANPSCSSFVGELLGKVSKRVQSLAFP